MTGERIASAEDYVYEFAGVSNDYPETLKAAANLIRADRKAIVEQYGHHKAVACAAAGSLNLIDPRCTCGLLELAEAK